VKSVAGTPCRSLLDRLAICLGVRDAMDVTDIAYLATDLMARRHAGAMRVEIQDENGKAVETAPLPCNPRGLMKLVNSRRNIVESLNRLKAVAEVDPAELNEQILTLSSIIRNDAEWDKNIQGVRGRLRMVRLPSAPGMAKLIKLHKSSSRFSIGVPLKIRRCCDRKRRAICAVWLEGFLMYWPSSRMTA